jgi:hypothetical protein
MLAQGKKGASDADVTRYKRIWNPASLQEWVLSFRDLSIMLILKIEQHTFLYDIRSSYVNAYIDRMTKSD